jgi:hypothetical protein
MSVASVQLIGQSIQAIVSMAKLPGQEGAPVMDIPTAVIISFTIGKFKDLSYYSNWLLSVSIT